MTLSGVLKKWRNWDKEEDKSNSWAQIWQTPKNNKKYPIHNSRFVSFVALFKPSTILKRESKPIWKAKSIKDSWNYVIKSKPSKSDFKSSTKWILPKKNKDNNIKGKDNAKDSKDNANRNNDNKNKNNNKIKGGWKMKEEYSRQRKRHKSPKSLNQCVHKNSKGTDQTDLNHSIHFFI
jgi:hypothetical protein